MPENTKKVVVQRLWYLYLSCFDFSVFYGKHLSKKRKLPYVMYMRRRVTCFYHNSCKSTHVIFFKCDYLVICRNFEHLDNAGYEFVNPSTIGRV